MEQAMNLQQRMDTTKETATFYHVFAMIAAGMILDGADVYLASAVNSAIVSTHFATLAQGSVFLSSGFLGLFFGSIFAGFIGDFLGRRKAYSTNLLIFGVLTLCAAFATNIWMLIGLRFFAAIGLGAEIVTGYALINEFAPIKNRGRWSGVTSVIANLAAPLTLLLAASVIPRYTWRAMFVIVGVLALILWVVRRHFPESPRWLIARGEYDKAEKIIEKLEVNGSYDTNDSNVTRQAVKTKIGIGLLVATVAVSAVNLTQYTFTSWMPTLLIKQGIEVVHSLTFSAVMMAGAPIGALIGALLVDVIGRKKVIVSAFVMTAVFGMIYSQQHTTVGILTVGFLVVTMMYILMASVVGVYMSELFPTYFRFRGTGFANGVAKILTVLTPYFAAWAITQFSANLIFYFIAAVALIAAIVVAVYGPETKQKAIY